MRRWEKTNKQTNKNSSIGKHTQPANTLTTPYVKVVTWCKVKICSLNKDDAKGILALAIIVWVGKEIAAIKMIACRKEDDFKVKFYGKIIAYFRFILSVEWGICQLIVAHDGVNLSMIKRLGDLMLMTLILYQLYLCLKQVNLFSNIFVFECFYFIYHFILLIYSSFLPISYFPPFCYCIYFFSSFCLPHYRCSLQTQLADLHVKF